MSAADVLAVLNGAGSAEATAQVDTVEKATPYELLRVEASLWPQIRGLIEDNIGNAPRERQKAIGPSELGTDCLHCLAAKLAGWQRRRGVAWLPFIGTCVHEHFERMFDGLNPQGFDSDVKHRPYETEMRVTVGELHGLEGGYPVRGSIDLYDRRSASTVDWKIVGSTTLKDVKAHGPSQTYMVQASLYGIGLRNEGEQVERNCIFFLPRNGISLNDALPVELRFSDKPGLWALARAQMLITFMDLIERQEGVDVRDAWIHLLPVSSTHCFDCGSWPDDAANGIPELSAPPTPEVPERWRQLIPLLDPTMREVPDM
ncbi:hypothetical protein JS533_005115 [Bifidobacterium amazonense]|uniref:PD-(D/E)XK endonuclease-like domain-containing protein n=1 Tax=Bifidobacterium amazonense TaxID=2809027 RepID=A0ABS9VU99_9BIFI|nr:hypothetical protein [Bifidobacterium amazonense]MCH9275653.1 hypothetical protein [Bifidobacterium amazonense]